MTPSVPSFCTPGRPPRALLVMSFHSPGLRISLPARSMVRRGAPAASQTSNSTRSSGRILRIRWLVRRTLSRVPPGMAMV